MDTKQYMNITMDAKTPQDAVDAIVGEIGRRISRHQSAMPRSDPIRS